jgi:hypothetical protein
MFFFISKKNNQKTWFKPKTPVFFLFFFFKKALVNNWESRFQFFFLNLSTLVALFPKLLIYLMQNAERVDVQVMNLAFWSVTLAKYLISGILSTFFQDFISVVNKFMSAGIRIPGFLHGFVGNPVERNKTWLWNFEISSKAYVLYLSLPYYPLSALQRSQWLQGQQDVGREWGQLQVLQLHMPLKPSQVWEYQHLRRALLALWWRREYSPLLMCTSCVLHVLLRFDCSPISFKSRNHAQIQSTIM